MKARSNKKFIILTFNLKKQQWKETVEIMKTMQAQLEDGWRIYSVSTPAEGGIIYILSK